MADDVDFSGGTQREGTAREPDLPRVDDSVRDAKEQDDSTKATAGVVLPGGTTLEAQSNADEWSGTVTIPFGGGASKPVDTTPSAVNPDAPADPGACVGADGQSYPNGWVLFENNQAVATCVNGFWMPSADAAPAAEPGDYPTPAEPGEGDTAPA